MAEGQSHLDLWQYEENKIIRTFEVLEGFVESHSETIVDNMHFSAGLWTQLQKYKVADKAAKGRIKQNGDDREMAGALLDHIRTVGQLRGLLMALVHEKQEFIIFNMGLDPQDFKPGARSLPPPNPRPPVAPLTRDVSAMKSVARKMMEGLGRRRADVTQKTYYDETFSDYLVQYEVIQDDKRKDIMMRADHRRMGELLDHLQTRPPKDQIMFGRTLAETKQEHILLDLLGLTQEEVDFIKTYLSF